MSENLTFLGTDLWVGTVVSQRHVTAIQGRILDLNPRDVVIILVKEKLIQ